tara:strand:- start:566 stop:853 length:288 start_codon:yes stop_codon:yes gene_type:complete
MSKETKTYFNTTSQSSEYVKKRVAKNKTQEEIVLSIFEVHKKLSASQVFSMYPTPVPLTSIRRAISNLTFTDKLEKMTETRIGIYNAPEHLFKLS